MGARHGIDERIRVVNSASTTEFTVYDNGNATLAGSLVQNSDRRLKTNIQDLDASSSLAEIEALNPVTFNWIDPAKSSVPQFGFIAQQVQSVFPNLVSVTAPTALTPDGTLSLNYIDLISPIVAAIQELDKEITSLASTVAGFAEIVHDETAHIRRGQATRSTSTRMFRTLHRLDLRHGSPATSIARVRQSIIRRGVVTSRMSDRHAARHRDQRRQPRDRPSRRELQRPRRDDHRPAGRPQPRHQDFPQRRARQQHRARHERRRHRHDRLRRDRQQGLTSTSTRTVIIEAANDNQPSNAPANDNTVATTTATSTP